MGSILTNPVTDSEEWYMNGLNVKIVVSNDRTETGEETKVVQIAGQAWTQGGDGWKGGKEVFTFGTMAMGGGGYQAQLQTSLNE